MIAEISRLSSDFKFCQKTFRNSIYAVGVGVHSGAKTKISFHPAPIDTGIVFRRVDVTDKDNLIPADYAHIGPSPPMCKASLTLNTQHSTLNYQLTFVIIPK